MNSLTLLHANTVPAILANAGENVATKFLEFFAAYTWSFHYLTSLLGRIRIDFLQKLV